MNGAPARVLVLGASYGLLPGVKLALAGHDVTFVGRADEVQRMAEAGLKVRIPLRDGGEVAELACTGARFATPATADPASADMVLLAMQEPQLADAEVAALVRRIAAAGKPCLSLMNLPPPPFLARLGIAGAALHGVYSSAAAWSGFDPARMSNASPDPQALRMDPEQPGTLTVTLASNFKAAPFDDPADQQLLERLARDLSRVKVDGVAPPVRMLAHSSPFVPLAKWPMLLAGNCRCIGADGSRTIAEAVLADPAAAQAVYDDVTALVLALGAPEAVLVPFSAYAKAAESLTRPSSAARAIAAGAPRIERIDLLVMQLMQANNLSPARIAPIVDVIDQRLGANRSQV